MSLADLIKKRKPSVVLSSATATIAIPATVPPQTEVIVSRVARIAGIAVSTPEPDIDLWGWFALEADRSYRSSSKSAESWELHEEHKRAANALCISGDISAARVELEKALAALHSGSPSSREPSTTSAYCKAYDGHCSVKVTGVHPDDCILMKCEHYYTEQPAVSPARTCYNCKSTDFWLSTITENHYVCRRCHPPAPGAELLAPDQKGCW